MHDERELETAVAAGADLIGVNNRNLRTLEVSMDASFRLAALMPPDVVAVAESGLKTANDLDRLHAAGYRAFLVGERFMTAADPGAGAAIARWERGTRMIVKICGITRVEDATVAVSLGATAVGFIFWPGSPRRIAPADAAAIGAALPQEVWKVGVFVDAPADDIRRVIEEARLTAVQLHGNETPAARGRVEHPCHQGDGARACR